MNNKGQSLVLFIVLIPVLLIILFTVYDIGNIVLLKEKIDNINYITTYYGLDNIDSLDLENKLEDMITKNKDDIDKVEIDIDNGMIKIKLEDKLDNKISVIKSLININITSSYVGYLENNKKIIRKDK